MGAMKSVVVERLDSTMVLSLNRPDRRNAINRDMAEQLFEACSAPELETCELIVLRGVGGHLCAGGDILDLQEARDLPGELRKLTLFVHGAVSRLRRLAAPLVVMAEGTVAGAGVGLVCCGDIVLCHEHTTFRAGYGRLGLSPDAGTTFGLPRIVGTRGALDFLLLGDVWDAQTAASRGLVSEVVAAGSWQSYPEALIDRLATMDAKAARATANLIWESNARGLDEQLAAEVFELTRLGGNDHARARMAGVLRSKG